MKPVHTQAKLDEAREHLRSEEHTSELQSPDHLVCRLLLEKKNKPSHTILRALFLHLLPLLVIKLVFKDRCLAYCAFERLDTVFDNVWLASEHVVLDCGAT